MNNKYFSDPDSCTEARIITTNYYKSTTYDTRQPQLDFANIQQNFHSANFFYQRFR